MLTRIEIDGFKSFASFTLDLGPLTVVAGANASGKSNLFDAIQLLSRLAEGDLRTAARSLQRGEFQELFRREASGQFGRTIRLAAELLLNPFVRDPWGQENKLTHTRWRYELVLENRADRSGLEKLFVAHEAVLPILRKNDPWPPRGTSPEFRQRFLKYSRQTPLLETLDEAGRQMFKLHQDGRQGRSRPAVAAEATVLSSITTAEFKHLFAVREELRSWQFLQLDPGALRAPASKQAPERLEPSGANLAAVLARIRAETSDAHSKQGALTEISADLSRLIPGVTGVDVAEAPGGESWELLIATRSEAPYTARVASDGTLRLLALVAALSDPSHGGVICFEEPENGVHPARLKPLLRHLRSLVSDPRRPPQPDDDRLVQLVLSTHSPVVVSAVGDGECVFFDATTLVRPNSGGGGRSTRQRPVVLAHQTSLDPADVGTVVTPREVEDYLATAQTPPS